MKILITGAHGFIGKALMKHLVSLNYQIIGAIRLSKHAERLPVEVTPLIIPSIGAETNWSVALRGIDTIIHLAGRAHVMKEKASEPLISFRNINTFGTERLAKAAAFEGVKRLIFISTIKVNGEDSTTSYTEKDSPNPQDPYAISKWEAEQILRDVSAETGMETIIIRPPLVYGPAVRANFLRMLHLVDYGIPLPFARINNHRSLIYIGNLVDAIAMCINHPNAGNQTFLVSDQDDVSTPDLIRLISSAMDKPNRLFSFPPNILSLFATMIGKKNLYDRLCGSLAVDASTISKKLSWQPPFSLNDGIAHTVAWYLRNRHYRILIPRYHRSPRSKI